MKVYNILHLENSTSDADLIKRQIKNSGVRFNYLLAESKEEFIDGLELFKPDMILSDHRLPKFNSKMAFAIAKEKYPNIPFLLITESISEEFAVEMMKRGIDDYLLKSNLQRLTVAIRSAFTKRKNEEEIEVLRLELEQSQNHLRGILNNSVAGIILLNKECNILEFNNRANYFTTLSFCHELKKMDNLLEVLPENRKLDFAEKFQKVLNGETVKYTSAHFLENGQTIYFDVNFCPTIDLLSNITGGCINFEDKTEQKNAQATLKESELLNRSILTSIHSHIAVVDENGLILEVNDAWNNFSIRNNEKLLERTGKGSNYFKVCQKAAARGDTIAKKVLLGFYDVIKKKIPFFEMTYPCHSLEEERWFHMIITKFVGDSGKVVINHTDISQLKKASKEAADYKKALDQSSILAITDQKGIIKHVNDNFCNIAQYRPEELIGSDHRIVNSGYHSKSFIKKLWVTIGKGKIWRGEICNKAKDGSFYWVDTTIVPFLNDKGKPFQYVAIREDITKRKQTEKDHNMVTADLLQRNKDLEQFAFIVSHNLRAPLANIKGIVSILETNEQTSEENKLVIKMLAISSERLDEVIADLNNVIRIKNTINDKMQQVTFSSLVNDISDSLKQVIDAEQILIEFDFSSIEMLLCGKTYLYNIFNHLITNSIKFRQQDVPLCISIKSYKGKNNLILLFKDNGQGINMNKNHDKVFGLYKRFHQHVEGKGIGLFMVKSYVEALDGNISLESEVNKGTTIKIVIPVPNQT